VTSPRIGLALSGGGFRATAFGLGCLRALHDTNLLRHIGVVSGISGGSLLAAMWAYGPTDFDDFEHTVVDMLGEGLQIELARRALSPIALGRSVSSTTAALLTHRPQLHNRTDSLIAAFADRPFGAKAMSQVSHPDLATVISATDVITGNAVRFGSATSSCSPHGTIMESVSVAEAVAASAAYPVAFPPITREYRFQRFDGSTTEPISVVMTDGGVYDNLGLSPLLPGRSPAHTGHSYDLDYLIAVDAGIGRFMRGPARFFVPRLIRSFQIIYGKAQDAGRSRIHLSGETSQINGFVHAYLGMNDERLPAPVADLVPRSRVSGYPTNFSAMAVEDLLALTVRGEQLTRTLLSHYCPELA
jgi:predicted acylesterase/phospholipase RssA